MTSLYYLLLILFIVLSAFLILLVLVQKGRGGGLSSAFGGVGGNTAFGAKTGDVLTLATSIIFGVFLLLAIGLNLLANHIHAANQQYLTNPTTAPAAVSNDVMPMSAPMPTAPMSTAPMPTVPAPAAAKAPATQPTAMSTPSAVPAATTQR